MAPCGSQYAARDLSHDDLCFVCVHTQALEGHSLTGLGDDHAVANHIGAGPGSGLTATARVVQGQLGRGDADALDLGEHGDQLGASLGAMSSTLVSTAVVSASSRVLSPPSACG
jgi:hypothetical protein